MTEEYEIRNAVITSIGLGIDSDRGFMTSYIGLDYGSTAQSFGGFVLKGEYLYEWVSKLLDIAEAKQWHDLLGKSVRVESNWSKVNKIGHLLEEKWFCPSEEWQHR